MQSLLDEFEGQNKIYETRSVFYTTFDSNPEYIRNNNLKFTFSFFQIPALFIDYYFRKKINSLREFLHQVQESKL